MATEKKKNQGGHTKWQKGVSGNPRGRTPRTEELAYLNAIREAVPVDKLVLILIGLVGLALNDSIKCAERIRAAEVVMERVLGRKTLFDLLQLLQRAEGEPPTDPREVLTYLLRTTSDPRIMLAASQSLLGLDSGGAALERFLGAMAAAPDPWAGHKPALGAEDWRPEGEE